MSNFAKCNNCSFEHYAALDHATKELEVICVSCFTNFAIVHNSHFGASPGERLKLWQRKKGGKLTLTNQTVSVVDHPTVVGVVQYEIHEVSCPVCDKYDILMGFDDGTSCPRCKDGELTVDQAE